MQAVLTILPSVFLVAMWQQDRKGDNLHHAMPVCIITEAYVPRSKVCCKAPHRLSGSMHKELHFEGLIKKAEALKRTG